MGIDAQSSLGIGERYHEPLRTNFRKMRIFYPDADKKVLLSLAVKAMKDTLGPEGLVSSSLIFGELPQIHTASETPKPRDTLGERSAMVHAARTEMQRIMAKMRVSRGLKHSVTQAADESSAGLARENRQPSNWRMAWSLHRPRYGCLEEEFLYPRCQDRRCSAIRQR